MSLIQGESVGQEGVDDDEAINVKVVTSSTAYSCALCTQLAGGRAVTKTRDGVSFSDEKRKQFSCFT